ncbi:Anaphase-promoting complex subunit 1 [Toensbergia leucococca]|nr:Anaphase-promoting complex subunit 1 [Toensbergia leucococca]
MASVTSLGIHKPSGIPYLVAEAILPPDPTDDLFSWQLTNGVDEAGEEEEIVTTEHCVIWSRCGVVQRIFRFDVEGETVTQAVLTRFPSNLSNGPFTTTTYSTSHKHDQSNGAPDALSAKSHRPGASIPERSAPSSLQGLALNEDREKFNLSATRHSIDDQARQDHALVVVLKTQAHVYFLSGTSHIVHLPFEVDAVFPLEQGLLLQRKVNRRIAIPPTPNLPSAPFNSFAFPQPSSSWTVPNSQTLSDIANPYAPAASDSPFLPLLNELRQQSSSSTETSLPRLFHLADPLTEMGIVVAAATSTTRSSMNRYTQVGCGYDTLGLGEDLLYISAKDELEQPTSKQSQMSPLIIAVTLNQETSLYTLWTVSYINHDLQHDSLSRHAPSTSRTLSRRRSSYGPGVGTGATTPTIRGFRTPKEAAIEESIISNDYDDLGSQLDPAFENPSIPAKSSRRISSLLARADLSNNHDRSTFSDLAGGRAGLNTNRRGVSLGNYNTRQSFGLDGVNNSRTHPLSLSRSSLDSHRMYQPPNDDLLEESDSDDELQGFGGLGLRESIRGLRKEVVFTKIHSIPYEKMKDQPPLVMTKSQKPEVFTLRRQACGLDHISRQAAIAVYITEKDTQRMLTVQIATQSHKVNTKSIGTHHGRSIKTGGNTFTYDVHVIDFKKEGGVMDACKIRDGNCSRILVLGPSLDGMGELSLRAPWSNLQRIQFPSSLFLFSPYQVSCDFSPKQKREGGFKRVLSQGPQKLTAIQHGGSKGQLDVVDSDRIKHRIEVQLKPYSPHVRTIIAVCDSVLPQADLEVEPILRGWWDVMSWISKRSEEEVDAEWTAIIVVLFSMATNFVGDRRTQTTARHKRRKAGLLRSSSGAVTDLESWEAMLSQEGTSLGGSPSWMQDAAWEWTMEPDNSSSLPNPSILTDEPRSSRSSLPIPTPAIPTRRKSSYLIHCVSLASEFLKSPTGLAANGMQGYLPTASCKSQEARRTALATVLVGLHLVREELKLNILAANVVHNLTPVLAQIGTWLGWGSWGSKPSSYYMLESVDMVDWLFDDSVAQGMKFPVEPFEPPSILRFIESAHLEDKMIPFLCLLDVVSTPDDISPSRDITSPSSRLLVDLTPRTVVITNLIASASRESTAVQVAEMASWGLDMSILETIPEGVAMSLRAAIASCQAQPSTIWDNKILSMIGRDDIGMLERQSEVVKPHAKPLIMPSHDATRDVHTICTSTLETESIGAYDGSAELDRQSITRMIFKEDQRFAEAAKLLHPLKPAIAQCTPEPDWSDTDLLEAQQELVKTIAIRTLSVSPGRGLLFFSARLPLLTEKFPIHGFTLSCVMKPANTTITADKNAYTEEKVSWAFFHAGVEAGLSITRSAEGIDTSWILFNKPAELNNRHAGFLLALGLNGHLKSIAKWVAFKYLTPKHTMTSIGLLLGLSASYLGTMDTLITRLLSVHVTRMLPPGAAELNLSPLTQTTGIMGIGLLYCNTQHRRMSEIMLSEMENVDQEDNSSPLDSLRDEGYRLAAGFALGYINLGLGKDLKGLHDMHIIERLLALAVGTRKVNIVHILDKATAAATVAIALIFMKTQDESLARKIDIPDTIHQFEYVRPDIFLLRTVARHLIMWDNIRASMSWMKKQLPSTYQHKYKLTNVRVLNSEDMPFFNIIAGICFSIGLRFAGTGSLEVRNLLCHYLDEFIRICHLPPLNYDGKLTRITVRNCQDTVALAASTVMAGTGDLHIFRRLRSLHGRTDAETPYGSHLSAHLTIGVLFLAGGTHTFSTTNLATASLLCAFYPLSPTTVLDNKSHLQAFRHFWVLAAQPRCLVPRDLDSHRPVSLPILITLRSPPTTQISLTAPCLLPDLATISTITTTSPEYWRVTLDLASNPTHCEALTRHQSIYVRRRAPYDAHTSLFSATLHALNDAASANQLVASDKVFEWVFELSAFEGLGWTERALVLPRGEAGGVVGRGTRGTRVDDRLVLEGAVGGRFAEGLWGLRVLFAAWEGLLRRGKVDGVGWLGGEVVEGLRARVGMRGRGLRR